ncbi:MAG TPA: aminotransferase class I/II-fold pyridoxal phosphate-dependent enzyme [Candidatus Polarisedimenticolaceae bacterium]|nr:aminotransferase class I/II-fold pyridoxal phosphate-dependent enzyme [Candidatus Polarisedimenticolaceae bacterium]
MTWGAARRMDGIERTLIRRIFDAAPPGSINLGLGQPDLPTPPLIALAGIGGIAAGKTGYTSTAGDPALRAAIARRYPGIAAGPDSVVVTIGSQEAVFTAMMTLVDPGDEVLVPDPGYPAYPIVARLLGARAVTYPLRPERAFRIDPEDVLARVTKATRLVILCSPSNPTGAMDLPEDLRTLARGLQDRGVPWISDEIYAGFAYDRSASSIATEAPEGGLVVSGLSKDLSMTGWRIGWVVGPQRVVARIIAAHQYVVTCASSVSQAAATVALSESAAPDRSAYLEIFRTRRALMAEELSRIPGLRVTVPDGAFYFFVDVRPFGSSASIAERLLARRHVITIPGEAFGPGGTGFIRISYAATDEHIERGVRALGEELRA